MVYNYRQNERSEAETIYVNVVQSVKSTTVRQVFWLIVGARTMQMIVTDVMLDHMPMTILQSAINWKGTLIRHPIWTTIVVLGQVASVEAEN